MTAGVLGALPMSVAALVVAGAGGRLLHRVPARGTIGSGLVLVGVETVLQSRLTPSSAGTAPRCRSSPAPRWTASRGSVR